MARDCFGLLRHRWEAANLKWDPNITTRDVPTKFGDDATDACFVAGTLIETEFGPVPIGRVNIGDRVWTREGLRQVICAGMTNANAQVFKMTSERGASVIGTANHPIWISRFADGEIACRWMPLTQCSKGDKITVWKQSLFTAREKRRSLCLRVLNIIDTRRLVLSLLAVIFRRTLKTGGEGIPRFTSRSGSIQAGGRFLLGIKCITETVIHWITSRTIWNACLLKNIRGITARGLAQVTTSDALLYTPQDIWQQSGIGRQKVESGNVVRLVADRLQRIELKLESAEKEIAELKATLLDENVYSQTKEALEMALLMLDEENQPPQWTREEAFTD